MKWGQWASTRADIFPPDMCDELARLQSSAPAHSYRCTKAIVESALGQPIPLLFDRCALIPTDRGYRWLVDLTALAVHPGFGKCMCSVYRRASSRFTCMPFHVSAASARSRSPAAASARSTGPSSASGARCTPACQQAQRSLSRWAACGPAAGTLHIGAHAIVSHMSRNFLAYMREAVDLPQ